MVLHLTVRTNSDIAQLLGTLSTDCLLQYWGHGLPTQEEDVILYNKTNEYLFCNRLPAFEDKKVNKRNILYKIQNYCRT